MRIDSNPLNLTQAIAPAETAQARASQRAANHTGTDQVAMSSLATSLSTDPQRLAELTTAVRSGTYHVGPEEIAKSMIAYAFGK